MANLLEYLPFGAAIVAALGLTETRLAKKVDKSVCDERHKVIDRIEVRMMRIENHFFERPLTMEEAEAIITKNNNKKGR